LSQKLFPAWALIRVLVFALGEYQVVLICNVHCIDWRGIVGTHSQPDHFSATFGLFLLEAGTKTGRSSSSPSRADAHTQKQARARRNFSRTPT
jgi:hypothetical protein